ncbi:ATP-binding protein [Novosphingobium rosa]|uniref:ATP-binding protein n=1 Tax=Novosphingobium rosa TaxID=76978 RepID=UPI00082FC766|nr:ATP-binding protein [Novosphingobium rosa]
MSLPGFRSLFAQVAALLLAALVLSQAVSVAIVVSLPPPRPSYLTVSAIIDLLRASDPERLSEGLYGVSYEHGSPAARRRDRVPPAIEAQVAASIHLPTAAVQIYAERVVGHSRAGATGMVDPLLIGNVQAFCFDGRAWRILQRQDEPALFAWRMRLLLWFAGSTLLSLPLGWFYSRGLGRTLRRFAAAADRLREGAAEPDFPVEGARELRLAGAALNQMHSRIGQYVNERTAMIAAIAHDLRTPLARIAFTMEEAAEPLRIQVQGDVAHMRTMIADTLAFVKGTSVSSRSEVVDLGALLTEVAGKYVLLGADVEVQAAPKLAMVGDPLSLERLFTNLIDNAIRYGTLARLSLTREEDSALIRVVDDGPGLPEDQLETVLQPFVRGDVSRNGDTGGIGLGLAIARAIARNHGGDLMLRNGDVSGLVALCRLPVS